VKAGDYQIFLIAGQLLQIGGKRIVKTDEQGPLTLVRGSKSLFQREQSLAGSRGARDRHLRIFVEGIQNPELFRRQPFDVSDIIRQGPRQMRPEFKSGGEQRMQRCHSILPEPTNPVTIICAPKSLCDPIAQLPKITTEGKNTQWSISSHRALRSSVIGQNDAMAYADESRSPITRFLYHSQ
jgi:hypothetical protein